MSTPSYLSRIPATGSGGIQKTRQESYYNTRAQTLTGGDANVYKEESPKDILFFRSLKAGSGITLTQGANFITIDGATTLTATSLGGDTDVYKATVADEFQFRGLSAGTGITLTQGANFITIDGATTLTATSLAGDVAIYKETVSDQLRFRALTAGTGISLTEGATSITIASTLTRPSTTTSTALVRWNGTDGNEILTSAITSDGNSLVLPAAGSITTRTIQSDNAFVEVTIEDVTLINGNVTGDVFRAGTRLVMNEQGSEPAYQTNAGNLWTDATGNLRYAGERFNVEAINLTPWTTAGGDLAYSVAGTSPQLAVLSIGSTGYVLTVASGLPSWKAPAHQSYEEITAVADDSTITAISTTVQHTFLDVTSDGGAGVLAKLTLANGTVIGTVKNIYCRTIANAGVDTAEVKITTYLDAAGASGTKSFVFSIKGQSIMLVWNGTQWQGRDTGGTPVASTF